MIYLSLVAPGLTDSFAIRESSPEIAPGSSLPGSSCAEFAAFVLARSLRNSWENEESDFRQTTRFSGQTSSRQRTLCVPNACEASGSSGWNIRLVIPMPFASRHLGWPHFWGEGSLVKLSAEKEAADASNVDSIGNSTHVDRIWLMQGSFDWRVLGGEFRGTDGLTFHQGVSVSRFRNQ